MSAIEIIAFITTLVIVVKILVVLIHPKYLVEVVKEIYAEPKTTITISLVLSAIVLYFLLGAGMTIVEIFAAMAFVSLLMVSGVAVYHKEMMNLAERLLNDKRVVRRSRLLIIVWIILAAWVLYNLYMVL